jgi:leader peptidase (prepilin peptidase)/N-methyltransferase
VVSWLVLRGHCAACKAKISARYPVVELTTGVLSAWVAWHFGFGAAAACGLLMTWSLIALTGIDIDHQLLPDNITLPLMWAGLIAAVALGPTAGAALPVAPKDAIIGAAAGYTSLWLIFHLFKLVTGKEGMGYGDFKLFAALGAWLGWKVLPLVIVLSAATGAVLGILMIALQGRDRRAPMPFGPYLAAAGWLAMMYGEWLLNGYLRIPRLRIGLTGGIASGKSTVTQRFTELGVSVIDADLAARSVVQPGKAGLTQVVQRFGPSVLDAQGHLDRAALRAVIFNDPDSRRALDAILHPLIRAEMELTAAAAQGPYVVMAIPLLIESGNARARVDRVLVVDADETLQIQRVQARDGGSAEQARAILASQASRAARLAQADDVLLNTGSVADLRQAVDRLHEQYLHLAKIQGLP